MRCKTNSETRPVGIRGLLQFAAVTLVAALGATDVHGQASGNPNVIVDLSVIGASPYPGYGTYSGISRGALGTVGPNAQSSSGRTLMMPGPGRVGGSRLLVAPGAAATAAAPAPSAVPARTKPKSAADPVSRLEVAPPATTKPAGTPKPPAAKPKMPEDPRMKVRTPAKTLAKATAKAPPPPPAPSKPSAPPAPPKALTPAAPPPPPARVAATPQAAAPMPKPAPPKAPPAKSETSKPKAAEMAAKSPSSAPAGKVTVTFQGEETRLSNDARTALKGVADSLSGAEGTRLQLRAYAGGGDLSASRSRRISLSRALAVRSFLMDNGIASNRIDVRALGDKTEEDPVNRVDLLPVGR